ncbi:hypothetical protein [Dermabacter hominis]
MQPPLGQPNPPSASPERKNSTLLWVLLGCSGALFVLAALTVAGLLAFMFLGDREEQASDPSPDTSSSQAVSPKSGEPETVGDTHLAYSEARGEDPDHDYVVRARYEDESGGGFEIGIENDTGRTFEEDTAGLMNRQDIGPWVCGTQYEMNVCMADDERGRILLVPLDTDAALSTIAAWGEEFMEQLK